MKGAVIGIIHNAPGTGRGDCLLAAAMKRTGAAAATYACFAASDGAML